LKEFDEKAPEDQKKIFNEVYDKKTSQGNK